MPPCWQLTGSEAISCGKLYIINIKHLNFDKSGAITNFANVYDCKHVWPKHKSIMLKTYFAYTHKTTLLY